MKSRILFVALLICVLTVSVMGQDKEHKSMKKPQITLLGDGMMKYACPMSKDMVFSAEAGKCTKCGMNLKEMTEKQMEGFHEMLETHTAVDKDGNTIEMMSHGEGDNDSGHEKDGDKEHNMMKMEKGEEHGEMMKHDPAKNTVLLMGEGTMTHTCPMSRCKVFSAGEGKCTECGMNLKKMSAEDTKKLTALMKTHTAIKKK